MKNVNELIDEYNSLICKDHHKDQDCHFDISYRWSYGEPVGWFVTHLGYCHCEGEYGKSKYFMTYELAEKHLVNLLEEWIKEEKELIE